jgi:hypothetical protein
MALVDEDAEDSNAPPVVVRLTILTCRRDVRRQKYRNRHHASSRGKRRR